MLRRILVGSVLCLPFLSVGCGSDDAGGGLSSGAAPGTAQTTGAGGSINVGTGSGGSTTGLTGSHDGGTIDLTPEEIETIEDSACAGWSTEGENLPAVLQLVVDISTSMRENAPGTNQNKWSVTQDALIEALDGLSGETAVGLLFYPNMSSGWGQSPQPDDACLDADPMIPIDLLGAPGSAHRENLRNALEQAGPGNQDATPTHVAYRYALNNGMKPYQSSASKFMLLITDGAPTVDGQCVGDPPAVVATQPIIDEIAGANGEGIRTFLIGSPGSEGESSMNQDMRPWLSEAAQVGGTATPGCQNDGNPNFCHMDMVEEPDFSAALRAGLGVIAGQLGNCTYVVPPPPAGETIDMNQVNLMIHSNGGSQLVLPDNQGACTEGWQINDQDQIVLCSATCERVQSDGGARVELLFGCASGEVPVTR